MQQKQVAIRLGASTASVEDWEVNQSFPTNKYIPRILDFLGYDPFPAPQTWAEKLLHFRRVLGVTREAFARQLGIDTTTLWRWESSKREPTGKLAKRVEGSLAEIEKERRTKAHR